MNIKGLSFSRISWKLSASTMRFGLSAENDWKIIFITSAVVAILSVVVCIAVYLSLDKREVYVLIGASTVGENTLNVHDLRETVSYYQNKEAGFEKMKSGAGPVIVDPSL